jgi:hypothetical protein
MTEHQINPCSNHSTKAETGVGAAIAAGNHEEKVTWALLVTADKTTRKEINSISTELDINSR